MPQKDMIKSKMKSVKEEKWKNKALHGQYPKLLEKPHVDIVTTNTWLSSNLKGETETARQSWEQNRMLDGIRQLIGRVAGEL